MRPVPGSRLQAPAPASRHINMSTKKITCQYCSNQYSKASNLNKHIKNHHRDKTTSLPLQSSNYFHGPNQTPHLVVCLRREGFEFTYNNAPHLSLQLDSNAERILPSEWFPRREELELYQNYHEIQEGQVVLHQSLVTAFHLRHLSKSRKLRVDIREWNSNVFDEFPGDGSTKVTFLILDTTDGDPRKAPEPWLQAAQYKDRHVSLYPSQREIEAEQGKVELIKVLDAIAKSATERKFKFRPKTCFGTGLCSLFEETITVYKRSWSASSAHVHISDQRLSLVPCFPLVDKPSSVVGTKRKRGQIHGEQGNTMYLGEFRVFLTPGSSSKGVVFHWVHTAVNRDNPQVKDLVVVTKPSGNDSVEFKGKNTTEEQLKEYALYYYEKLRKVLPNMSFDHGVRLDIGASGDGRLWVVEITPWYSAHYFSLTELPSPNTQVCKTFATSLACSIMNG
ncbi:hypothetical protein M0657_012201 [Pyricularia oryzae]|nr:hypothetical protein M0657_012201 [Pyricularia oryzae]